MVNQIPADIIGKAFDKWELTIKDSFDLKDMYIRLQRFLKDEDWLDMHGDGDNFEVRYSETTDVGGNRFYQIWWRAHRAPYTPTNGYYHFYMKLDIATRMLGKKEVMINGKKQNLDNGELVVKASFYLHQNAAAQPEWESNFIMKFFKNQFWNQIKGGDSSATKGELRSFSQDLYSFFQTMSGIYPEDEKRDFYTKPKGIEL